MPFAKHTVSYLPEEYTKYYEKKHVSSLNDNIVNVFHGPIYSLSL